MNTGRYDQVEGSFLFLLDLVELGGGGGLVYWLFAIVCF